MMTKNLNNIFGIVAITFCLQAVSFAEPVPLFSPYPGSDQSQSGFGMACVERFSSSSIKSDFLLGFPSFFDADLSGFAQVRSGQDGSTLLFNDSGSSGGYGYSGASIGDINSDGFEEIAIGDAEAQFVKIASSVLNSTTVSGTSAGASVNSGFGHSVAGLYNKTASSSGLVMVVGAPLHTDATSGGVQDGLIAFYDAQATTFLHSCRAPINSNERFGWALASIQDLDADGVRDIIVSSIEANSGNGRVDILSSNSGGSCSVIRTINGSLGAKLGTSLAAVGDQNGDGIEDFIVGGPSYTESINQQGIAILYSGSSASILCTLKGAQNSERFGTSVGGIGDANYDGKPDFAVGAPGKNGTDGEVVGYSYNSTTQSCSVIFTIPGGKGAEMGKAISGTTRQSNTCDMNNDGFPEFIVATGINSPRVDAGSAVVYSIPVPTPAPTITPTRTRTPTPAVKLPDRSRLTFRITESGTLSATNVLDRDPKDNCTVRLQARYSMADLTGVSSTRVLVKSKKSKQITKFQARGLPKTKMPDGSDKPYILHLIARNTCGKKTFASNVFSRYLNCGLKPAVPVQTFTNSLAQKIR